MASSSSSSRSWRYDVFPSFRGEDVRKGFLSYLLRELKRKSIHTFIDNGIERSRPIAPELLLAIEESRISIVVFSRNYASSTWCLNELVHIHKCFREINQMVIPIFYYVDPSHVRKQTGEFGKVFDETCIGNTEDDKERWIRALAEVAAMAGYDSQQWDNEAEMTENIATDVSNKLNNITPSDDFADLVGIEAHLEKLNSMLCLESGGVKMVGIVGTSGIGKSTIARALFNHLSSQFDLRSLKPYKRTLQDRKIADINVKLSWVKQLLSDILGQNERGIESLGLVKQRLKNKKVLIVLDDVDERELLETLVGQPGWFGFGSRIIVVSQDRELLTSHKINLIYDVELPLEDLALKMLCRSAFGQDSPPDGFKELASKVVEISGRLRLGVKVLGSTLSEKSEKEWTDMLPGLQDGLDSNIERTLKVSYDGLGRRDQDTFLHIACLFNREEVNHIKDMLGNDALRILVNRSLISIRPPSTKEGIMSSIEIVEMHGLLEKLGREIVRAESTDSPEKRRFLMDAKEIYDVFNGQDTGAKSVVGIYLNISTTPKAIDEKAFVGMRNLQFLKVHYVLLCQGLIYLPPKLKLLHWYGYRAKSLPSSFCGECLVELIMEDSELEKLWEGTKPLQSLKKMILDGSGNLKEIPDLSNATNLEILGLSLCTSLVELHSSVQNLKKLKSLDMFECSSLESFPRIPKNISQLDLRGTKIKEEEDCCWIENLPGLTHLYWQNCPLRYIPSDFHTEYLVILEIRDSKLEKLWDGVKPLRSLKKMMLTGSKYLKKIPDFSNATNLEKLSLRGCTSLVELPSTIQNLQKLRVLKMRGCTNLESLPTDVNLETLDYLDLRGCSSLQTFPQISKNISVLCLDGTAMDEEDCLWIENLSRLNTLIWESCPLRCMPSNFHLEHLVNLDISDGKLEKLWEGVQSLGNLKRIDLSGCKKLKEIPDLSKVNNLLSLTLSSCTSLVLEYLPTNLNLSLTLNGCSRITTFPQLSTTIENLNLDNTAIEEVPSWIEDCSELRRLSISGCKMLRKISPEIRNLKSLFTLTLRRCSRLTTFPQLSTSIEYLDLDDTAIEEVPSWIEDCSELKHLSMRGCVKLRKIFAKIKNLRYVGKFDFTECGSQTAVSYANLAKLLAELHPASIRYYTQEILSSSDDTEFLLAQGAQEYILQRDFKYAIVPGKQVPRWYFKHQNLGSSLTVPLPQSSQQNLEFAGCISLGCINLGFATDDIIIFVHWKFRGVKGICRINRGIYRDKMYPQVVFHFDFNNGEEVDGPPSQFNCNNVEFEFEVHNSLKACCCYKMLGTEDRNLETCPISPPTIKECGIRYLSEIEDNQQDGEESDVQSERLQMTVKTSKEPSNSLRGQTAVESRLMAPNLELSLGLCGASDHVSSRNKVPLSTIPSSNLHGDGPSLSLSLTPSDPCLEGETLPSDPMITDQQYTERMRMTVEISQEPSNSLCGQTAAESRLMAPNLELSLGLCGASDHVSSRNKVPLPTIPSSNLHGDGPSLSLSLTPTDPCLEGGTLPSDPMITDQQDTETPVVDPLSSPHLINFFSQTLSLNLDLSSGLDGPSRSFHSDSDGPSLRNFVF